MQLLSPSNWKSYSLIDCGEGEKLEQFGPYTLIRPEPQALWKKQLSVTEWQSKAHAQFIPQSSSSGKWNFIKKMPEQWTIDYQFEDKTIIKFRLGLTKFKHVGIFPEQACNWDVIYQYLKPLQQPNFLNLFAYTGGASLAAKAAGANVTHIDSIKQVITWANENMTLSKLDNIRWLVDDAMKFTQKEVRRGNRYEGIILDPPAYGHGPDGETWKLDSQIQELINSVLVLLNPNQHLLILNTYSLGFSALIPKNLLQPYALKQKSILEYGELYLPSHNNISLPLGVWGRLTKK